ncbi:MAG: helicase-exonuclease AddAB subunit AddA [Clostridia bacterium]|nr:helicase-exonuclease AddAB subunit AddA [Clostridia bacterium]
MPEWTSEQLKAIDSRDGTVLVSAAAGSGKTAVLVERVIRRLMDKNKPCSADRLLIVTFTRAATQQMRERIFQAISDKLRDNPDDAHLKRQLVMLPFANISTIDSFCGDIVRENFHDIDIAPDYKMLEGAQLKLVEADAISRTLDELYKENSDEFTEIVNILANGTDDSAVGALIQRLYNNSIAFAQPDVWLDGLADEYNTTLPLAQSRWGRIIVRQAKETVAQAGRIAEKMQACLDADETAKEKYSANVLEIEQGITALADVIENGSWNEIKDAIADFKLSNLGRLPKGYSSDETEFIKEQKKEINKQIKEKLAPLFCSTEEENAEDMTYMKPLAEKMISAVKRYGEILAEEKRRINSVDFSDISHLALNLLVTCGENGEMRKTKLAESISEKFDEILVDEFQDINELQSALFRAVSKDDTNMFTVGDVKQSIYRFRQAMPEIFLKRRDKMADYVDGNYPAKIILDRNFRSRSGVTENVNFVFSQIMSKDAGGLDYTREEELVAAAPYEPCDFAQTELHIIGDLEDEKVSRTIEAQHIADIINDTIKEKMQITDKNGTRDATYRDFCILMRATGGGRAETYAEALSRNNIPVYVSNKAGFFQAAEINSMLNLMRVIDNPIQDIPLLAVLLSPFFGFTADELARMRIDERKKPIYHCLLKSADSGNRKSADFLDSLERLRMLSSTLSCADFVRELYDFTGCKAIANAMKNGSQRNANLNMLVDYASKYEETGKRGLSGFIRFIDRVQQQNGDLEAASDISEAADVVRIMTIHKSKGLEFPVCILADLNSKITNDNQTGIAAFHPDYGICFERRDGRTKCQYPTVGRKALTVAEKNSAVSEELRVLYVAMTRAKEKLICVTRYDHIQRKLKAASLLLNGKNLIAPFLILNENSMADWLIAAFMRHPDAEIMRKYTDGKISVLDAKERLEVKIINSVDEAQSTDEEKADGSAVDEAMLDEIRQRIAYEYPYASLAPVRAKSAPSDFEATRFDTSYFASSKPQFLSKSGMNPAARGTATHKFMEFFDYSAQSYDVEEQTKRMVSENHLTQNEADVLEKDKLRRFFSGEIADRIRKSPLLMREKKVTVGIKAGELYPDLPDNARSETVVIQGYVDCAFEENGKLVIVDYKTDRNVTMDELRERYGSQLKMYEYALGECTGMEIAGTLIYSFDNGTYIEL